MADKLTPEQIAKLSGLERFFYTRLKVPPGMLQLVLTYGIAAVFLLGLGAYWLGERVRVGLGGKSDEEMRVDAWEATAPKPLDVDGDGAEDIVGLYAGGDGIYLGAFETASGKLLWRQGPITSINRPANGGRSTFGVAGDYVILAKSLGSVELYGVRDGKRVGDDWKLGAWSVCAAVEPDEAIRVKTSRGSKMLALDVKARSSKELPGRPRCRMPSATARLAEAKRYGAEGGWAIGDGDDVMVMNREGTELRGLDPEGKVRWKRPVPKHELFSNGADAIDLAGGRAFLGYKDTNKKDAFIQALDAKTGKQLWLVPMKSTARILSLSASAGYVYAVNDKALLVLDAKTGAQKGLLGGGDE
jgi:outer membrane protein assembly factor BamB